MKKLLSIVYLLFSTLLCINSALGQAPTITSISPTEGPVGSLVTITGTNLGDLTALSIAGVTGLEISNDGSTLIGFVMPGATTGTVDVTTLFGNISSSQSFTVNNPAANPALQLGADLDGEAASDESGYSVSLSADGLRLAVGAPGNDGTDTDAGQVRIYEWSGSAWGQVGLDIDGEAAGDQSGWSVSLSANGHRVAIGALGNNGFTGHVRVYEDIAGVWTKIGDDIDGEAASDQSGYSVSLSADGQRVAIGARLNGANVGHVRIYQDNAGVWTQIGLDIDGENTNDQSAFSVSLSANGQRVAIGAPFNAGNGSRAGHVRIFEDIAGTWTQLGVDIDGEAINEEYGWSVSLSADGERVAIGATAVLTGSAGYVRIYEWSGAVWNKVADIDGEAADDRSGISVSLSADGNRVAIGARLNAGGGLDAGHVRIYEDIAGTWSQIIDDIDGEAAGNESGRSVSLSADGERLAIGAPFNNGNGLSAGHVRIFSLEQVNPIMISDINPSSATVGTEVTISGTGFNSTPTNNIVFFGTIRANVTAGTTTELTVNVPTGAIYAPISVLDITTGLSASSLEIFTPTFTPFKNSIEVTDFAPKESFATDGQANTFVINDFDGDGKNDIIIRVSLTFPALPETSIFRNTSTAGNISFAPKVDIPSDYTTSITADDLDGDGKPELIFTEFTNSQVSILRNTSSIGSISFAPKVVFPLGNEPFGSAVGDLDGDGKPDLAIVDNVDDVVSVLVNASTPGTINFETKVDFATEANPRHIIISDLDGDGIVDVATGNFSNTISILRNTSTIGNLSFDAKIDLPSTEFGSIRTIAVGDFDGDGKRDLATANASDPNLSVYRNNSSLGVIDFDPHIDLITGSSPSSVLISDFNGDGRADLAAVNTSSGSASISIFKNNSSVGSIDFANQVELPIESGSISSWIDAADIDGDGRTDFISSKSFPAPFYFSVFRNNPLIPPLSLDTNLPLANATSVDRNAIIELDFDADVDLLSINNNSTNANEVYDDNIIITGNVSGQIEGTFSLGADNSIIIFSPSKNFVAGEKINVTITSSVLGSGGENAIPTSFSFIAASGPFEGAFIETTSGILGMADGSFDWGDYDNDGDLDVIVVGYDPDFNTQATIYRNDNGIFTDIGAGLTGVFFSAVEWGDYDNDGDLDLVVAGLNATGTARLATIYRNNGDNTFTDIGAGLQGVDFPALDWGDFDNDGDLDLIITGRFSFGPDLVSSIVYQNNAGIFTDIGAGLQGLYNGSADWGDYDRDGDLDLLLTGFDELSGRYSLIYDNINGTFTDHLAGLPGIGYGDADWGDYDNDGDLDLILLGDGTSLTYTSIFNNEGNVFTDISAGLPTTSEGSAKWGDYDGDGDLDLILTGFDYSTSTEITNVYSNNGSGSFTDINARLQTFYFAGLADFLDFDGDGDLDIFVAGESTIDPSSTSAILYENTTFPIFYSQNSSTFDTPTIWNSAADGSGFNPIASNFTDGKTDFIIQGADVISAAAAAISMNNFTIEEGGSYQNGSQDVVINGSATLAGTFSDAIAGGESTFFGPLIIESTGSFTTSGVTNNSFRFYGDITNRGTFNLTSSVFWHIEADLTILNESSSAMSFSSLNSGIGNINANVIVADSPGGANVLLRSNDYIRMADNTTLRNELGDYPINSRILEIAELRALSGSANFENASNAIVLLRDDNLGTFDAINFDFTAMDNLVRYFSNGNVLAVDHYHMALTAGATSALLGSINVFGDLTINNGNVLDASGNNITIAGDWINSNGLAGFLPGSGIVSFNGSNMDPQIISGETNFNNVVINNTGSSRKVTAGNSISIASSFTLTSGVLEVTDGNMLSLSAAATASGAFGISEMIQLATTATVRKYFDTDGSFTFPIGTANIYNETSLTLTTGTNYNGAAGSRYVELNLIGAEEPNVLIPGFALTKYWTVNSVNLDNISGSLALTYDGLDATNGDENDYLAASYDGNWNTNSNVNAAANTISFAFSAAPNLNANYTAGEPAAFLLIPTISTFTPASAPEGEIVTIEGTNFNTATAVSFGGTPASSFTIVSNTEITAEIGSGTSGNISVTNLDGTASSAGFTFIPVPTISEFTPASAAQGETVSITGTGFTFASAVSFGGTAAASFTVDSDTEISAVIGAGASGNIAVTTPGGTTAIPGFAFIPAPTISAFTPTSAAQGETVTIEGTNFTDASAVSFGGTAASSTTVISSTEITATVGAGSSGDIIITTNGGTATSAGFEFIPAPSITSFSPTSASTGETVTIIGTNFTGANLVTFGGTIANFTTVSDTQITATVGDGASGEVGVATPGGTFTLGGFILLKPELAVFDASGNTINNNQNDTVNFGATLQGSSLVRQFTIENSGSSNLSISDITSSNGAFQVLNVPDLILPGTSAAFSLEFGATDLGIFSSEVIINNNTSDIPKFIFTVNAELTRLNIIDNDTDSIIISNQAINLGSTFIRIDIDKLFNIENVSANSTIEILSITVDNPVFQIINAPTSIPETSSAQFTVRLIANEIGDYTGIVTVITNLNEFSFQVAGIVLPEASTEIRVFNVVTPNGDGRHDFLFIENITEYTNNSVTIFNRWGNKVFEISRYDNTENIFDGMSDNGEELLTGNYYYVIDKGNGDKRLNGFLIIKR